MLDLFDIYLQSQFMIYCSVKTSEFRGFKMRLNERYFACRVFVPIKF